MTVNNAVGRGLLWDIELYPFIVDRDIILGLVEADAAECGHRVHGSGIVAEQACACPDIALLTAEYFGCIIDRGATTPNTAGEGVFAFRGGALIEIATDQ